MPRQIFLFSPIFDFTSEDIIKELLALDREGNEEITMFINSPGGSVNAMFSIIDVMNAIKSPIRTVVIGQAASAAAIIASSGKKRLMTESSRFMLHEIWTFIGGSVSEMDDELKQIRKEQEKLVGALAKNTGKTADQIKAAIKKQNKFFDSKESKRFGLVDEIIKKDSAQVLKLSEGITGESFQISSDLKEVQLLRTGEFEHPQYGPLNITPSMLEKMKDNFDKRVRGVDLSLDYTHDNESGESPAACWMKSLEIRNKDEGQAMFAKVEFTPKGEKLVSEKEFKYASADFVFSWVNSSGEQIPYVLRGGTLTNRPFITGMNPIKLSEKNQKKEIKLMDREAMLNALRETYQIDVVSLQAQIQTQTGEIESLNTKIKELSKMPAEKEQEIADLKNKVLDMANEANTKEKNAAYETLVEEGKVIPAQKEKILKTFNSAEEMFDFYKDVTPTVKKKEEGDGGDGQNGEGLNPVEMNLVNLGIVNKDDVIKHRKIKR